MYEIRLHSRGGQGGVTAAKILASAAFMDGKYATACPFYGAERRGAAVVSFIRLDDQPIRVYSQIRRPDLVIVLDKTVDMKGHQTCHINLTEIALSLDLVIAGSPILNTPLLGALAKMGLVSRESVITAISETFKDERNVRAALMAYEELEV